jgi:hypothetical protein
MPDARLIGAGDAPYDHLKRDGVPNPAGLRHEPSEHARSRLLVVGVERRFVPQAIRQALGVHLR